MNRNDYRGPKLPKALLDRVGGAEKKARGNVSRKDRRKAEREAKKGEKRIAPARRVDRPERRRQVTERRHDEDAAEEVVRPIRSTTKQAGKPLKSVLKPAKSVKSEERQDASETDIEIDGNNDDGEDDQSAAASDGSFTVSRQAAKAGLADEDDEIAALERRLGIKGKKRTKDVGDDELDWMVTGSDESDDEAMGLKRKRPDDERWLKDKRRKAGMKEVAEEEDHGDEESMEDIADADAEFDDVDNPFSDDELSIGDFDGFDSEHDSEVPPPAKKQRENPYVAPVSQATILTGKYVPPSLRKPASSEEEAIKNLRRQTQGQLNRLSDANLPSILQSMEELYTKHARQHVTSTLIDLLVSLVSDPSPLNDPFIILHAGFATAVYKVIGPDFGAQLLEEVTKAFDQHSQSPDGASEGGKNRVNLIAFLSNLYTFQLVASPILYDYIRLLLNDLSEPNTELLLRILRTSGSQLRHEDPTALKDIVILLQRHTTEKGEDNLSVRTKYMMEIITDLKNNRHGLKTGVIASALAAEHTTRMKKILGSLNTRGSLRATEPLRVTLADLSESGKKGKWWLVGASYHDHSKATLNSSANTSVTTRALRNVGEDTGYDSATPGHTNLTQAARAQGMNTDIRRQIFVNLIGADDYRDAFRRIQGLGLRGKQLEQEVPRVLLHCVGVEEGFNRFYGLVARELCGSGVAAGGSGAVGKGFRVGFWGVLKELKDGEEGDGSEGEEDGGRDGMGVRKIVNLAKFYGSLIADEIVSLTALKTADFALLRPDTKAFTFAEVLFTTLFLELRKKSKKSRDTKAPSGYGEEVQRMFEEASKAPQMIAGLQRFLREVVAAARLAQGAKGVAGVKEGCNIAVEALGRAAEEGAGLGSDEESDED
ncbi:suppressor of glycerol defect [Friedmanniomyces endolithicus]|uniref:Suppressor of glycerol defect n=1 Tax=Friedmanniomyces endolithicus TaxID=329885 RepID=A0AAN6QSH0_9PEZI|nr:suppressor of glycerol defect [Friedmanniomyces endolithicus]KAK0848501.1 suppressor of glycerol defect [Friedmanniomyces endolithicus]KAK0927093.1 suppressor of glycerol defect [Friedmanniomyces endolithicus]KAK0984338.1 suppressor of glycerol defect [Friedmanniomyces endolithicus]KAK0997474.1 suppressor of glycerol defect [Friedmanniomyces endolithicus]